RGYSSEAGQTIRRSGPGSRRSRVAVRLSKRLTSPGRPGRPRRSIDRSASLEQRVAILNVWSDFFDGSNHYTGPPLTDAMVASAERALGYKLPVSYLHLLRAKNGSCPNRHFHPTAGELQSTARDCGY